MMERIVTKIGGIEGFGVISICLFFVVFTSALVWAFCQKKTFIAEMESLPLQDEEPKPGKRGGNRHD
jgi:hypothetical protein